MFAFKIPTTLLVARAQKVDAMNPQRGTCQAIYIHLKNAEAGSQAVKAKFLVGCHSSHAHSW